VSLHLAYIIVMFTSLNLHLACIWLAVYTFATNVSSLHIHRQ